MWPILSLTVTNNFFFSRKELLLLMVGIANTIFSRLSFVSGRQTQWNNIKFNDRIILRMNTLLIVWEFFTIAIRINTCFKIIILNKHDNWHSFVQPFEDFSKTHTYEHWNEYMVCKNWINCKIFISQEILLLW